MKYQFYILDVFTRTAFGEIEVGDEWLLAER